MKIETLQVAGFEPAFQGMRNPMNSWNKSDSILHDDKVLLIGQSDMDLAKRLVRAGAEHRKFLRQIQVWANVDMPRYWWSEADTYSFGTKNSCSTMHKLLDGATPITSTMFEYYEEDAELMVSIIIRLEELRLKYQSCGHQPTRDRILVRAKRILPEGFLQMRTWNTNYEELRNMYHQRKYHRLKEEWQHTFCRWVETLPYANELIVSD